MESGLSFRLQDGKIHLLEEEIESWRNDHTTAMAAWDLEDLVGESLSLWVSLQGLWGRLRKLATKNRIREFQQPGESLLKLFERQIRLLQKMEKLGSVYSQQGYAIDGLQGLPVAIMEAEVLRDHIRQTWPWDDSPILPLNREMAERSRKSIDKAVPVEEILSKLGSQPGSH